jgi:MFS family permease
VGAVRGPAASLHYGWIVVAAAFSVLFLTYGVQYSFGLFFTALADEFGWSRASLSGVFSLYAGAYALLGLVSGRLTDRWGPRTVVALGALLLGAGLVLSGMVRALIPLYGTYLLAAMGMSTAYVPCTSTVARWFSARRGLAVGLAMSGAGLGIFACPPLVARLLDRTGWRLGYAVLGVSLAGLLALLARLFVREPAVWGLHPYGALPGTSPSPSGHQVPAQRPAPPGDPPMLASRGGPLPWSPAEALHDPGFRALTGVYVCTWAPVFMPLVHLVPLARDLGVGAVTGAAALSTLGVGSIAGRLGLGALSDRLGRRVTLGAALGLQALAFVGLALAGSGASLLGAAFAYGVAYGAITALMPAIVADFYGAARAGSLVGLIFGLAGPPGAIGPILGGLIFDATGRYTGAFLAGALLNLLGLTFLARARPPSAMPTWPAGRRWPLGGSTGKMAAGRLFR